MAKTSKTRKAASKIGKRRSSKTSKAEKAAGAAADVTDSLARVARLRATEDRVAHIAEMMRRLDWERGKSVGPLARLWKVSESRIRDYSSRASKIVRAEVTDRDEVSRDVGVALRTALMHALRRLDSKGEGQGARRDIIKAAEAWATVTGAKAPERRELTGKDGTPLAGDVTPEAVAALVRQKFGEHAAQKEPTDLSRYAEAVSEDPPEE